MRLSRPQHARSPIALCILLAVAAIALALGASACGGDDSGSKESNGGGEATTTPDGFGGGREAKRSGEEKPIGGDRRLPSRGDLKRTRRGLEPSVQAAARKQIGKRPKVDKTYCGPTDLPKDKWTCIVLVGRETRSYAVAVKGRAWRAKGYSTPRRPSPAKGKAGPGKQKRKRLPALKGML